MYQFFESIIHSCYLLCMGTNRAKLFDDMYLNRRFLTKFKILNCFPNFMEYKTKCKINTKHLLDLLSTNRLLEQGVGCSN